MTYIVNKLSLALIFSVFILVKVSVLTAGDLRPGDHPTPFDQNRSSRNLDAYIDATHHPDRDSEDYKKHLPGKVDREKVEAKYKRQDYSGEKYEVDKSVVARADMTPERQVQVIRHLDRNLDGFLSEMEKDAALRAIEAELRLLEVQR